MTDEGDFDLVSGRGWKKWIDLRGYGGVELIIIRVWLWGWREEEIKEDV